MAGKKEWRQLPFAANGLNQYDTKVVEALITAQDDQGDMEALKKVEAEFIFEQTVEFELVLVDQSCSPPE